MDQFRYYYETEFGELGETDTNGWVQTRCPFHPDSNPSLGVNLKTGGFNCFGCGAKGPLEEFYMKRHNVNFETACRETAKIPESHARIVATFDYINAEGGLIFQACRYNNKSFRLRRPEGNGNWIWNVKGIELIPYNLPEVIDSETVFICEGEKDCDTLAKIGLTATCNPMGAGKWRSEFNQYFRGKDVVILPDNDKPGHDHADNVARNVSEVAKSVKVVNLPGLSEKGDVSDFLAAGNTKDALLEEVNKTPIQRNGALARLKTARELVRQEYPDPKWAVPGILPEGLNILGGKPKYGKSIMALNICMAITTGVKVFGNIQAKKGRAVYLSLEDTERRLDDRVMTMITTERVPDTLHLATEWPKMGSGGLRDLEVIIKVFSDDLRLVVIDTLQKFRPLSTGKQNVQYQVDYEDVAKIKALADKYKISILLVHHLRKMDAEDVMDTFSGTLGLTGAADGLLALIRKSGQTELHVTGRDVESEEYALRLEPEILRWEIIGKADEVMDTSHKQKLFNALKQSSEPLSPKELSEITGLQNSYVKKTLPKLIEVGNVRRIRYGKYVFREIQ